MTDYNNESAMTTEYEKMRSQQLYCFDDAEVMASIVRANELCTKLSIMTLASIQTDSRSPYPWHTAVVSHHSSVSLRPWTWNYCR